MELLDKVLFAVISGLNLIRSMPIKFYSVGLMEIRLLMTQQMMKKLTNVLTITKRFAIIRTNKIYDELDSIDKVD